MKRIPTKEMIPSGFRLNDEEYESVVKWMAGQPDDDLDTCVNASCRWTYMLTDEGIYTLRQVRDNATKQVYTVSEDPDKW